MLQEKAIGVRILKEVEELAVSKLDASQQSASDAACQAAKQFLHEAPYEQVTSVPVNSGFFIWLYLCCAMLHRCWHRPFSTLNVQISSQNDVSTMCSRGCWAPV